MILTQRKIQIILSWNSFSGFNFRLWTPPMEFFKTSWKV